MQCEVHRNSFAIWLSISKPLLLTLCCKYYYRSMLLNMFENSVSLARNTSGICL